MANNINGCLFPFQIDASGGIAVVKSDDKLRNNVIHLLLTAVGQRVMRRDYGGGLGQLLHDPNNDALRAIVQYQVAKAIGTYEPRVLVQSVNVTRDELQGGLTIGVTFTVRRTRQVQQVSVPLGVGGI
jgi:phage baseplate assembly protein W